MKRWTKSNLFIILKAAKAIAFEVMPSKWDKTGYTDLNRTILFQQYSVCSRFNCLGANSLKGYLLLKKTSEYVYTLWLWDELSFLCSKRLLSNYFLNIFWTFFICHLQRVPVAENQAKLSAQLLVSSVLQSRITTRESSLSENPSNFMLDVFPVKIHVYFKSFFFAAYEEWMLGDF